MEDTPLKVLYWDPYQLWEHVTPHLAKHLPLTSVSIRQSTSSPVILPSIYLFFVFEASSRTIVKKASSVLTKASSSPRDARRCVKESDHAVSFQSSNAARHGCSDVGRPEGGNVSSRSVRGTVQRRTASSVQASPQHGLTSFESYTLSDVGTKTRDADCSLANCSDLKETTFLKLFFFTCDGIEAFRLQQREEIRAWVDARQQDEVEWLLVFVTRCSDSTAQERTQKKIFEKLKPEIFLPNELKSTKTKDRFCRIMLPLTNNQQESTRRDDIWAAFIFRLREAISASLNHRYTALESALSGNEHHLTPTLFRDSPRRTINSLSSPRCSESETLERSGPLNAYALTFSIVEELASLHIQCGRFAEALILFQQNDVTRVPFTRISFFRTMFRDSGFSLLHKCVPPLLERNETLLQKVPFWRRATYFEFRCYLFSRQFLLLVKLNNGRAAARLCYYFVRCMTRELHGARLYDFPAILRATREAASDGAEENVADKRISFLPNYFLWIVLASINVANSLLSVFCHEAWDFRTSTVGQSRIGHPLPHNNSSSAMINSPVSRSKASGCFKTTDPVQSFVRQQAFLLYVWALSQWRHAVLLRELYQWAPLCRCPTQDSPFCASLTTSSDDAPFVDIPASFFWQFLSTRESAYVLDRQIVGFLHTKANELGCQRMALVFQFMVSQSTAVECHRYRHRRTSMKPDAIQAMTYRHSSHQLRREALLSRTCAVRAITLLHTECWIQIAIAYRAYLCELERAMGFKNEELASCYILSNSRLDRYAGCRVHVATAQDEGTHVASKMLFTDKKCFEHNSGTHFFVQTHCDTYRTNPSKRSIPAYRSDGCTQLFASIAQIDRASAQTLLVLAFRGWLLSDIYFKRFLRLAAHDPFHNALEASATCASSVERTSTAVERETSSADFAGAAAATHALDANLKGKTGTQFTNVEITIPAVSNLFMFLDVVPASRCSTVHYELAPQQQSALRSFENASKLCDESNKTLSLSQLKSRCARDWVIPFPFYTFPSLTLMPEFSRIVTALMSSIVDHRSLQGFSSLAENNSCGTPRVEKRNATRRYETSCSSSPSSMSPTRRCPSGSSDLTQSKSICLPSQPHTGAPHRKIGRHHASQPWGVKLKRFHPRSMGHTVKRQLAKRKGSYAKLLELQRRTTAYAFAGPEECSEERLQKSFSAAFTTTKEGQSRHSSPSSSRSTGTQIKNVGFDQLCQNRNELLVDDGNYCLRHEDAKDQSTRNVLPLDISTTERTDFDQLHANDASKGFSVTESLTGAPTLMSTMLYRHQLSTEADTTFPLRLPYALHNASSSPEINGNDGHQTQAALPRTMPFELGDYIYFDLHIVSFLPRHLPLSFIILEGSIEMTPNDSQHRREHDVSVFSFPGSTASPYPAIGHETPTVLSTDAENSRSETFHRSPCILLQFRNPQTASAPVILPPGHSVITLKAPAIVLGSLCFTNIFLVCQRCVLAQPVGTLPLPPDLGRLYSTLHVFREMSYSFDDSKVLSGNDVSMGSSSAAFTACQLPSTTPTPDDDDDAVLLYQGSKQKAKKRDKNSEALHSIIYSMIHSNFSFLPSCSSLRKPSLIQFFIAQPIAEVVAPSSLRPWFETQLLFCGPGAPFAPRVLVPFFLSFVYIKVFCRHNVERVDRVQLSLDLTQDVPQEFQFRVSWTAAQIVQIDGRKDHHARGLSLPVVVEPSLSSDLSERGGAQPFYCNDRCNAEKLSQITHWLSLPHFTKSCEILLPIVLTRWRAGECQDVRCWESAPCPCRTRGKTANQDDSRSDASTLSNQNVATHAAAHARLSSAPLEAVGSMYSKRFLSRELQPQPLSDAKQTTSDSAYSTGVLSAGSGLGNATSEVRVTDDKDPLFADKNALLDTIMKSSCYVQYQRATLPSQICLKRCSVMPTTVAASFETKTEHATEHLSPQNQKSLSDCSVRQRDPKCRQNNVLSKHIRVNTPLRFTLKKTPNLSPHHQMTDATPKTLTRAAPVPSTHKTSNVNVLEAVAESKERRRSVAVLPAETLLTPSPSRRHSTTSSNAKRQSDTGLTRGAFGIMDLGVHLVDVAVPRLNYAFNSEDLSCTTIVRQATCQSFAPTFIRTLEDAQWFFAVPPSDSVEVIPFVSPFLYRQSSTSAKPEEKESVYCIGLSVNSAADLAENARTTFFKNPQNPAVQIDAVQFSFNKVPDIMAYTADCFTIHVMTSPIATIHPVEQPEKRFLLNEVLYAGQKYCLVVKTKVPTSCKHPALSSENLRRQNPFVQLELELTVIMNQTILTDAVHSDIASCISRSLKSYQNAFDSFLRVIGVPYRVPHATTKHGASEYFTRLKFCFQLPYIDDVFKEPSVVAELRLSAKTAVIRSTISLQIRYVNATEETIEVRHTVASAENGTESNWVVLGSRISTTQLAPRSSKCLDIPITPCIIGTVEAPCVLFTIQPKCPIELQWKSAVDVNVIPSLRDNTLLHQPEQQATETEYS